MTLFVRYLSFLLLTLALAKPASAQSFLDVVYDEDIPTLSAVIGHESGEEITSPADILTYMQALAEAAPDRMQLITYGQTWQGRDLVYAVIAKPETMARLDTIKADLARIGSGRVSDRGELNRLVAETPAVTWLAYGVHGDEISSPDAALALSYHLLAATDDEVTTGLLENTIVIIDPLQNPDGRARFVHSFESSRGLEPFGDRYAAEHDQPWPRGRTNHYLFDMNRDWFAVTQPETRGRISAMLEWFPVTVVDAHEMGGDLTYFFPPSADPFNPNITPEQRAKQDLFGKNHARWFDPRGIGYFTREIFDAFYPGFADTWPQLNGAVAMTYEQGSARGLLWTRPDDSILTYRDGVEAHFLATLSTAQTVSDNKDLFLRDYASYRASAVSLSARASDRYYVIDRAVKPWQVDDLAQRLELQGIEVDFAAAGSTICRKAYPGGALIVDSAQPNGRLIRTLLDLDTDLPADFIAEQEAKRARGEAHELYDVTAWSLPLMDGLQQSTCGSAPSNLADRPNQPQLPGDAAFGYAIPWTDTGQAKLVIELLKQGLVGKISSAPFTMDGQTYPRGTVIFTLTGNPDVAVADLVRAQAGMIGAEAYSLDSSWTDDGPNFGSPQFKGLSLPSIAIGWGEGTSSLSAGNTRFVLERQLGLPVTPIRLSAMGFAGLESYDVVIVPELSGSARRQLGDNGLAALKAYADQGGVLVGYGSALRLMTADTTGLLSSGLEASSAAVSGETDGIGNLASETDYVAAIGSSSSRPEDVPGVLLNTVAETSHWLSTGYDGGAVTLYTGRDIYQPLTRTSGVNVLRYPGADELLASGYLWAENQAQLAYKPYLMAERQGSGLVIGFTQSPTTRAYLNGLNLLVLNSVVMAPAMIR